MASNVDCIVQRKMPRMENSKAPTTPLIPRSEEKSESHRNFRLELSDGTTFPMKF